MKRIIESVFAGDEEYVLVRLSEESAEELFEAEQKCFADDPWTPGMIEDTLKSEQSTVLGVYNRQLTKMAAYGVIYHAVDDADIANIAVLPDMRRRGIGKALLEKMTDFARAAGAKRIFLEVRESNAPAIGLYKKLGFEIIGKRRNYYIHPRENALVMLCVEASEEINDNTCN